MNLLSLYKTHAFDPHRAFAGFKYIEKGWYGCEITDKKWLELVFKRLSNEDDFSVNVHDDFSVNVHVAIGKEYYVFTCIETLHQLSKLVQIVTKIKVKGEHAPTGEGKWQTIPF